MKGKLALVLERYAVPFKSKIEVQARQVKRQYARTCAGANSTRSMVRNGRCTALT
jgi:hypothetical protein